MLHKSRMENHLIEQEIYFGNKRNFILETLQVTLAYMFRKRRARRIREEEFRAKQRIQAELEARVRA